MDNAEMTSKRRDLVKLVLLPYGVAVGLFFLIPILFLIYSSVHTTSGSFTWGNYTAFITSGYARSVMIRTLTIGVAVTVVTFILGYPFARAIVYGSTLKRLVLTGLVLFPLLSSAVVRSYGWLVLLSGNGLLNKLLAALGLPKVHVIFTSTGVVIALAQVLLPFMVLTLVSAMNHIDTSLEDAARTLGSSRMRCFLRVTLPLLMPGILAGSLLVFAISISTFVTPALVGGAGAEVMSMTIYTNATQIGNMGLASSASMILLIMTIIIISIYYRLTASSVKINEGE